MTVKANELRIGNFVYNPNLKEFRCLDILDIRDFAEKRLYLDFESIPLTEEWLIKFGFTEEVNSQFVKFWRKNNITIYHRYDLLPNEFILSEFDVKIQYVHQLQNLYFTLTGKELIYESISGK